LSLSTVGLQAYTYVVDKEVNGDNKKTGLGRCGHAPVEFVKIATK
jgi:hypothetical protein